jgi:ribosomal protein S18 acetylase RimI-like enzyme
VHPLDNPVWHALRGVQRGFAEWNGLAARYEPKVAMFSALPDEPTAKAWHDLEALVGTGGVAVLFRDAVPLFEGWSDLFRIPTRQMVITAADRDCDVELERLAPTEVAEMLELVAETQPGPFAPRTVELGTYLGVRRDGALVAMAGERMHLDGHTEISAVCTRPEYRGRGLASALIRALVGQILSRNEVPFLHVVVENVGAIRVYESLGFTTRRVFDVVGVRAPG